MLNMPEPTIRAQRAEPPRVVRTRSVPQRARGRDVQVRALLPLRTDAVFGEFFAFPLVAEVEGVREFAGVAFFAQAALVVFAD